MHHIHDTGTRSQEISKTVGKSQGRPAVRKKVVKFYTGRVEIVQILGFMQKKCLLKKADGGEYTCRKPGKVVR